jgi:predicted SnoaL-like aldol condensation-catalyzing enzyme
MSGGHARGRVAGANATSAGCRAVWCVVEPTASDNKDLVTAFFRDIRNGADLGAVQQYLAPVVVAHQLCSEDPIDIERTPQSYADHVADMIDASENFSVTLDALIADGALVYARWTQRGIYDVTADDGDDVRTPITEFASAVYRIDAGKIVEYWLQIDRLGTQRQLERV